MKPTISFQPADILLPKAGSDMTRWAVVACDQYTSQPDYWEAVDTLVGDAPSTLRLVLPESKLEGENVAQDIESINKTMECYLKDDIFDTYPNAMFYIERTQQNGKIRRGLVGKVDLEEYDYTPGSNAQVRATEGTVLSRIPPRVNVRRNAPIELPHVMLLTDDPERTVIEPIIARRDSLKKIYDFDLMQGGGHIAGWLLDDESAAAVQQALENLANLERFNEKYHANERSVFLFAAGDGNHSLATAKTCYEAQKAVTPPDQWATLPARFALCELVNLHDEALEFEPIHRIVTGVQPKRLMDELLAAHPGAKIGGGDGHTIHCVTAEGDTLITVTAPTAQLPVGTLQEFLDDYLAQNEGAAIDYIHGEDVTRQLATSPDAIGFLLPAMEKSQLYPTVIFDGVLPRKTFSMGEAHDKRFYLEARTIK